MEKCFISNADGLYFFGNDGHVFKMSIRTIGKFPRFNVSHSSLIPSCLGLSHSLRPPVLSSSVCLSFLPSFIPFFLIILLSCFTFLSPSFPPLSLLAYSCFLPILPPHPPKYISFWGVTMFQILDHLWWIGHFPDRKLLPVWWGNRCANWDNTE